MKLHDDSSPAAGRTGDIKNNQQVPESAKKSSPFREEEQYAGNDLDLSSAPFEIRKDISDFRERKALTRHLLIKCVIRSVINIEAGVMTLGTQRKISPLRY